MAETLFKTVGTGQQKVELKRNTWSNILLLIRLIYKRLAVWSDMSRDWTGNVTGYKKNLLETEFLRRKDMEDYQFSTKLCLQIVEQFQDNVLQCKNLKIVNIYISTTNNIIKTWEFEEISVCKGLRINTKYLLFSERHKTFWDWVRKVI